MLDKVSDVVSYRYILILIKNKKMYEVKII